jgi:hypothetical protein
LFQNAEATDIYKTENAVARENKHYIQFDGSEENMI